MSDQRSSLPIAVFDSGIGGLTVLHELLVSLPAAAIPAFARRYKTSCITCHTLPPQLNPAGQAFRANGYRLPQGEPRRQEDDVQLGAPEWEALFPRSFLPGNVPEASPVAGLFRAAIESEKGQPDIDHPGSAREDHAKEKEAEGNRCGHAGQLYRLRSVHPFLSCGLHRAQQSSRSRAASCRRC